MDKPDYTAKELKQLGDVVGLPDATDKANIITIIKNYEKENPGQISHIIQEEKRAHRESGHDEFNVVNKDSRARHIFELPEGLVSTIEDSYPLMFRDKKHFAWFVKNFKVLMLPDKY